MKRTELRRVTPLRSTSRLSRTGSLRPRSAKTAALYRAERVPLVKRLLLTFPICQRCHVRPSQDVHELLSRARGGSITDPSNLACLCRPCHSLITEHPRLAAAEGWALSRQGDAA